MSRKLVAIIHTGPVTIEPLKARFASAMPGVRVVNIMDDSLLTDTMTAGSVTPAVRGRMFAYFKAAESLGADVILNACSSVGEVVDAVRPFMTIPIVKIDEAMAREAVRRGSRIGVAATTPTTLDPSTRLIEAEAREAGKAVTIERMLCPGAYDKLLAGKAEEHDEIVLGSVKELASRNQVVVLAQVSMARLMPRLGGCAVLASPDLGVADVKGLLARTPEK